MSELNIIGDCRHVRELQKEFEVVGGHFAAIRALVLFCLVKSCSSNLETFLHVPIREVANACHFSCDKIRSWQVNYAACAIASYHQYFKFGLL